MRYLPMILALFSGLAAGQIRLSQVENGVEQPVGSFLDFGAVYIGAAVEKDFRVQNTGTVRVTIDKLFLAGSSFELIRHPTVPYVLAPGDAVDFSVRFRPRTYGASFSSNLTVNTINVILAGRTISGPTILGPDSVVLDPAANLEFGQVARGDVVTRRITLRNDTPAALRIGLIRILGESFHGPADLALPVDLPPSASFGFDVSFQPADAGTHEGWLQVDDRAFRLAGVATGPPFPKPVIILDPPVPGNAMVGSVSIRLGVASPSSGTGQLELRLIPASPGAVDDAVQFLANGGRVLDFHVREGETVAFFDTGAVAQFQTGTTAGEIELVARLGSWTETLRLTLNPAPVSFDSMQGARTGTEIEVRLTGFDNTRSISSLAFFFYLRDGSQLPPGPVRVTVSEQFRQYFESSTLGGVFGLRVRFPVSGDASLIQGVEVEVENAAGTARTRQIPF
jgi:hypothetical protein